MRKVGGQICFPTASLQDLKPPLVVWSLSWPICRLRTILGLTLSSWFEGSMNKKLL